MLSKPPTTAILIALGGIFVIVAIQSIFPRTGVPKGEAPIESDQACSGTPIFVTYPYQGGMLDPWECKVQCDDKVQRYIVYTNGRATPCEVVPGCLDYGEDYGITCTPPASVVPNTTTKSQS